MITAIIAKMLGNNYFIFEAMFLIQKIKDSILTFKVNLKEEKSILQRKILVLFHTIALVFIN